jgi:hypothetical protein
MPLELPIEKHIKKLQETGIIKRVDGTRGHWEVTGL